MAVAVTVHIVHYEVNIREITSGYGTWLILVRV